MVKQNVTFIDNYSPCKINNNRLRIVLELSYSAVSQLLSSLFKHHNVLKFHKIRS